MDQGNQCRNPSHNESPIQAICCAQQCSNRLNCNNCLLQSDNQCKANHPENLIDLNKLKYLFQQKDVKSQFSQLKKKIIDTGEKVQKLSKKITQFSEKITNLDSQLETFQSTEEYLSNTKLIQLFDRIGQIFQVNNRGLSLNINFDLIDNFLKLGEQIWTNLKMVDVEPIPDIEPIRPDFPQKDKITLHLHESAINCVAISPDSSLLASSSYDETIKLTDLTIGKYSNVKTFNLKKLELKQMNFQILSLAFSENSKLLASGGENILLLWDLSSPQPFQFEGYENSNCSSVFFNKEYLISGGQDIKVWNISTKQLFYTFKPSYHITGIVAHNQYIITIQFNGQIQILDLQLQKIVLEWKAHSRGLSLSLSPDRQSLVSSSIQGEISLWDLSAIVKDPSVNPKVKDQIQIDFGIKVYSAKLSQDNKILVSCGSDNKSKVWDMKSKSFFTVPHQTINNPEQQRYNGEISNDMKYIIFGNMKYVDILLAKSR